MKPAILASLLVAVVMYPVAALGADAGGYSYTTLQIPNTPLLRANGINSAGDVVGTYAANGAAQGFVY